MGNGQVEVAGKGPAITIEFDLPHKVKIAIDPAQVEGWEHAKAILVTAIDLADDSRKAAKVRAMQEAAMAQARGDMRAAQLAQEIDKRTKGGILVAG